jgi:O-antigen ligase
MAPFLLTYKKINIIPLCLIAGITHSAGMVATLAAGIAFYGIMKVKGRLAKFLIVVIIIEALFASGMPQYAAKRFSQGRGPIWKKTIELTLKRPIAGYGISSYQLVFPAMSHDLTVLGKTEEWNIENIKGTQTPALQTHNCWLQFWFELGSVGMALILLFVACLTVLFVYSPKTDKNITATTGLIILGTIMLFHFPTRLFHTVGVFICYLAFYEKTMKQENGGNSDVQ